jgi:quinol monooxygenase YgiN
MVVLTAYSRVRADRVEEAIAACRAVRSQSVQEPGCERYDFFQSPDDPQLIVFVEEWTSIHDLHVHFEQPAFNTFMEAMNGMLESPAEIRIFDAQKVD